ncbi:bifunctional phosphoribosyl-AMP cyclohydrolase/phosphoribosyl-ATP diphosphatase HisIE [Legionella oakridgensis]|uniref:Histidine biosynthesis bifunctional protein HisIE n=2 Tax=Legionella oakridgensis TaxID=29423 RepID=W0BD49_9GAMM|nr:bifunctional phosphoribosyl-AMP cyclohydrolase/phosphoribosyl-ATP diphosphatase HisIE [Legionella oakridgensis]AHE66626.1 phosphoribosyl-ATP pyrophosphohydrolase [Legionella oakridgensis ATCC 33761 = DSM 21215]ETO93642.1 phosphoribosyl-ATP pyrophosphatase/phosphoribosyl-AMP cyclohydrolase [Legionella oakridgensis RV-2-2007]KTD37780.1 bifunctional phosphoribosyl-AMP cyclohydrolase/phosphoribosyl-ATP pyrophosphatase protein [Legionella oakridgensis]STY19768.1 phosphoribosyl-ATP pyrophosphohydr
MNSLNAEQLDWQKMHGLLPAIIQDARSGEVLMLAYMNQDALAQTLITKELILYSRSKQRLWRKGETSGNTMTVQQIVTDCDGDSLLIQVLTSGPACHLGFKTCFQPAASSTFSFLNTLSDVIAERAQTQLPGSYVSALLTSGVNRCAQKVGEEAVETVIAALGDHSDELINEAADLIFHLLVLLHIRQIDLYEVLDCLQKRHAL